MASTNNDDFNNKGSGSENRSKWPLLLGILGLLVILTLVLTPLFRNNSTTNQVADNSTSTNNTQAVADQSAPISSVSTLLDGMSNTSLQGRTVSLADITVKSVGTNDMTFWINTDGATNPGQHQGQDIFVHMSSQVQSQLRSSGITIKDGLHVALTGTVNSLPDSATIQSQWKLNSDDTQYLLKKVLYVEANNVYAAQPTPSNTSASGSNSSTVSGANNGTSNNASNTDNGINYNNSSGQ